MTLLENVRDELVAANLGRKPDVPGPGGRPWLPTIWRHPDDGPVAPGDAVEQGKPAAAQDDGLVISLMWAPGIPPPAGEEERRQDGVDIVLRGIAVPAIAALEAAIRQRLIGKVDPGGRSDFVLAGGLYVIQCRQWRPFQPVDIVRGIYTFSTGYLFETRVP